MVVLFRVWGIMFYVYRSTPLRGEGEVCKVWEGKNPETCTVRKLWMKSEKRV